MRFGVSQVRFHGFSFAKIYVFIEGTRIQPLASAVCRMPRYTVETVRDRSGLEPASPDRLG